jgi:chromosome segregation ATPase
MRFGKPFWLRGPATRRRVSLPRCLATARPCGRLLVLLSVATAISVARAQTPTPSDAVSPAGAATMASPSPTPTPVSNVRRPKPPSAATRRRAVPSLQAPASELTPSTSEALVREYEIRLNAHRRELLEREAELEAARREISELRQQRSPPDTRRDADVRERERSESDAQEKIARLQEKTRELEAQVQSATAAAPTPSSGPAEGGDKELIASLQRELDLERENRATLEKEMQRLASESRPPDQLQAVSQSLDGARAEILVLNHRLAEEQRAREALEVTIERVRQAAGVAPGNDWLERFQTTMNERQEQAERLQEELHKANEAIVALKANLESARPADSGAGGDAASFEGEIKKLKDALQTAQQANADLRAQAELAARLAELLYGQSR